MKKIIITLLNMMLAVVTANAQVGDYRNVFSIGVNGGYALNQVNFTPTVTQSMHGGFTGGLMVRYTSEKYFSTLCAVQMEVNIAQLGWKQDIQTYNGTPVINPETGLAEEYKRDITYIQIPFFAHLSWGKERKGVNAFINLGPQFGYCISDKTTRNYTTPYIGDGTAESEGRINPTVAQEDMPVENKFDYGIAVGAGIECDINHIGRFNLEGRYYYGLGNIYGDSKRDNFAGSNHTTIYIKLAYLFDLTK